MNGEYDIAVIGAGPGGYVAAIRAAQSGARVCIVEKEAVGGVCLNRGCIPTKSLISSVNLYRMMRRASEYGIQVSDARTDFSALLARKDRIVDRLKKGVELLLRKNRIDYLQGKGRLEKHGIEVEREDACEETFIKAKRIVIAAGSCSRQLPGIEFDGQTVLAAEDFWKLTELPKSICIVGAGAVGCEYGFILNALGCSVTLIETMDRILPEADQEVSRALHSSLEKTGMSIRTGTRLDGVSRQKACITCRLSNGEELAVEKVLLSIGRMPRLGCIADGSLPIETEADRVRVNEFMETTMAGVYAVGDVVGEPMLAHVASAEGIIAAGNATGARNPMSYDAVPSCVFTSPQVASVGLTEEEARKRGHDVTVGKIPFRILGQAHALGSPEGFVKVIAEKDSRRVLGTHIIGHLASELLPECVLAVRHGLTAESISSSIHTHPTLSEGIREAMESISTGAIHLPPGGML